MKTKSNKKLIVFGLMVTMFALYAVFPLPQGTQAADSIINASDTLSDSDIASTEVTHTITFTTVNDIAAGGLIDITFDALMDDTLATTDVTCGGGGTASVAAPVLTCTYAVGLASSTITVTVPHMTNPSLGDEGDYNIDIDTYDDAGRVTLLDRVVVKVYIIQDVLMTATVDPILEFTLTGVTNAAAKTVNGVLCNGVLDTTASSTPFGTLSITASTTICQQLNVETNADDGYIVTVEQDQEMTSDSNSNINSFDNSADDTGSSTSALAHTWLPPNNTLDEYHTYGHMGLTSDDTDLSTIGLGDIDFYNSGAAPKYVGFAAAAPIVVMSHDGPSDGTTQDIGLAFVAYTAEIGSLQEAGDYESTLTYIATPTF